jgi:hypothetical protein
MLSSSAIAHGYDLDLAAIGDPELPTGIPGGTELLKLVDAVIAGEFDNIQSAQTAVIDALNPESLVDAASVFGNFEMMNRVAEGTGIPIPAQAVERMASEIEALGIGDFIKS